jgi:hypothetical protein
MATSDQILRTFRFTPRFAPDLAREVANVSLPQFDGVRVESLPGSDGQAVVVVLVKQRTPVHTLIVSAPESCENPLRIEWTRWARCAAEQLSAPATVLIVTADLLVERWARQPVYLDSGTLAPVVLGPSALAGDLPQTTPVLLLMTLSSLVSRDA